MRLLTWWCTGSGQEQRDGIICDGAVRSGKTICMALSFFLWSMANFQNAKFAVCAKTLASAQRNVVEPIQGVLEGIGMKITQKSTGNYLDVQSGARKNRYYLFSGKDRSKAALIQGMTLSGVLFDEAALQDRSFVEQAAARCSVQGSKFWFNCNPEYPSHWFYTEWIQKREEKNLYYLHFVMDDNPSLSPAVKRRYESLYSGSFYRRFIKGEWVNPQGSVYPMFSPKNVVQTPPQCSRFYLSCDYGTVNPCSMGLWGESGGKWYRLDEFYYDSKKKGSCKTDEEYYAELKKLCGSRTIEAVIVDPSAASFIECIRRHGEYRVKPADNRVMQGIQLVSRLLEEGKLLFCKQCADSLREFGEYRWEEGVGKEQPKKENDHAMDEIRYFAMEVFYRQRGGFCAISQPRA